MGKKKKKRRKKTTRQPILPYLHFLFRNGIKNTPFAPHNHHQPLMPIPCRNYVCTHILSQYPDHPANFFWASFLFPSTHEWFQDRGCVWDGVPVGVGAGNQHGFKRGRRTEIGKYSYVTTKCIVHTQDHCN